MGPSDRTASWFGIRCQNMSSININLNLYRGLSIDRVQIMPKWFTSLHLYSNKRSAVLKELGRHGTTSVGTYHVQLERPSISSVLSLNTASSSSVNGDYQSGIHSSGEAATVMSTFTKHIQNFIVTM